MWATTCLYGKDHFGAIRCQICQRVTPGLLSLRSGQSRVSHGLLVYEHLIWLLENT